MPELQNIKIKTRQGQEIRIAFVRPLGEKWLCIDYAAVELRLLAAQDAK
jgi:DNA polymerase I-like protein with 3'-5' exonuclease and polymerase domains